MKKIVLVAIYMAAGKFVFAQPENLYIGVKSGVNIASLNVDKGVDYTSRASLYAGGLAHLHLTPHFALQHELFFSGQGGKNNGNNLRLAYLNSPLLAQYMAAGGLRFETGPQLGFLLAAKEKDGNVETTIKDQIRPVDFSWVFGVGYLFPGTGLGVDARYNVGVSNINDGSGTIQNRVLSIGLFYQWQCAMHEKMHRRK